MDLIKKNCIAVASRTIGGLGQVALTTANGKILGKVGGGEINIAKSLEEFNQLPLAERRTLENPTNEPSGATIRNPAPPGVVIVRVYIRNLTRDAQGELRPNEYHSKRYSGPQRDFVWLLEPECRSMVPPSPAKGQKFPVPTAVANRICCFYLWNSTQAVYQGHNEGWRPEQIKSSELTLAVEDVSSSGIRLRLEGFCRFAGDGDQLGRKGDFNLLGYLNYDPKKNAFNRFDIVAVGDYSNPNAKAGHAPEFEKDSSCTLGLYFELAQPESLGYGVPPHAIYEGRGNPRCLAGYFGIADWKAVDKNVLEYFTRK